MACRAVSESLRALSLLRRVENGIVLSLRSCRMQSCTLSAYTRRNEIHNHEELLIYPAPRSPHNMSMRSLVCDLLFCKPLYRHDAFSRRAAEVSTPDAEEQARPSVKWGLNDAAFGVEYNRWGYDTAATGK